MFILPFPIWYFYDKYHVKRSQYFQIVQLLRISVEKYTCWSTNEKKKELKQKLKEQKRIKSRKRRLVLHFSRFVDIGILLPEKVDTWQFDVKFHLNFDMFSYKQILLFGQIWKWLIHQTIPGNTVRHVIHE